MKTTVCVVGGGPAGLVLGLLLARQGIQVTVLEKHADFLRDFRGDTVHPSTLDVLDELDLGPAVQRLPGRAANGLRATFDDGSFRIADFGRLRGRHRYLLFLPQWDLLDLLADAAEQLPTFTLLRSTEAVGLIRDGSGRIIGVRAVSRTGDGGTGDAPATPAEIRIEAQLTVACDGRGSTVREALGLRPLEHAAPMDVLWFRLPKPPEESELLEMRVMAGGLMLQIDRGDYFQCAYVVPKGGFATVKGHGLTALRRQVTRMSPQLEEAVQSLQSWDDVKLLTVRIDRLRRWHAPGVLLIGDAAHAMSPIGGVGINLAVQDAVATARLLGPKLSAGTLEDADLARVTRRRWLPTVVTQGAQRIAQARLVAPILAADGDQDRPVRAPRVLHLLRKYPVLQAIPAYFVGKGVLPERVR
ncbi:MAG TPA: FAD-dependent oxidoreductase [Kineosporiaceae bacterium]|nr:FAD-dependent oxidoreductase [Kineosporiaceae bacterium]